jgi:hypothetical protein
METMTTRSQELLQVASRLAERLPPEVREIAVTGSVSKQRADAGSDIEMNLSIDHVPDLARACHLLADAGAEEIMSSERWGSTDGTKWVICRFAGEAFEVGWQSIGACDELVERIGRCEVVEHEPLMLADILTNAVALRTSGAIAGWQTALAKYPEGLAERITEDAIEWWTVPNWITTRWLVARRGQRLALAHFLYDDLCEMLRVLWAINRRWEPDWKWLREEAAFLDLKPRLLAERVESVFEASEPKEALRLGHELVMEVLELAPEVEAVAAARRTLREGLDTDL